MLLLLCSLTDFTVTVIISNVIVNVIDRGMSVDIMNSLLVPTEEVNIEKHISGSVIS